MNIIYIGTNGFPIGMATIQRQKLIAKGFIQQGNTCLVLSKFGVYDNSDKVKRKGKIEGIDYLTSSPIPYRPTNFTIRLFSKVLGYILETYYIIKNRKSNTKNILFSVRTSFLSTIYYRTLSKILGYKYVADINEALGNNKNASLNDKLFDKYNKFLYDGVLLISDSLMRRYTNDIPKLKIPIICDITKLDGIEKIQLNGINLLYCASATYVDTLKFVINVFEETDSKFNLILIISGSDAQMKMVQKFISKSRKKEKILLKSRINYDELIGLFKGADLLMIPLPEIEQHKARFPHKIAEYTACKTPIITNAWGEISNYFSNEDCFLVEKYSINGYVNKINSFFSDNNVIIAEKAYNISKLNFDYKHLAIKINNFLTQI